jgi:hypothetical protein
LWYAFVDVLPVTCGTNFDAIDKVVEHLEKDSLALIEWFSCNQMKANRDKFQALAIGKKSMDKNIVAPEFFLFYLYWLHYKSAMQVDRN